VSDRVREAGSDGVVSRAALAAVGIGDAAIRQLVRGQTLRRLRPGWYATPHADPAVCRAVALGGALTCISALDRHGVWVPDHAGKTLHLRLNAYRRRWVRGLPGIRPCACGPTPQAVDGLESAVIAAAGCLDGPELVAVLDSVLHQRRLSPQRLRELLAGHPRRVWRWLAAVDGSAESGTETLLRLYFRSRHVAFRAQVFIPGVGTVDFLVGTRLVVEADSRRHHAGDGIEADRERDLELHRLGFRPFRVSYQQVFHRFDRVAAALDAVLARGEHRGAAEIDV